MNRALAEAVVDFISEPSRQTAEVLSAFNPRAWKRNHHWLITSGLAMHLLQCLRETHAENVLPARYREHLSSLHDASGIRTAELLRDLLQVNRAFSALGIPFANWKGFALQPDFCSDIRLRPQMDFDFIIPAETTDSFARVLAGMGYTLTDRNGSETRYELDPSSHYSLDDVFRPKPHRKIELHAGSDSADRASRETDLTGALERRRRTVIDRVEFPVLAPGDAFLAHAAHAGKHAFAGWLRVSWLLELNTFIERQIGNEALWQEMRNVADPRSLPSIAVALLLLESLLRRPVPRCLHWAIDALPKETSRFLDNKGRDLAFAEFPGTKLFVLLNRSLMDVHEWRRWERSVLLPIHKPPRVSRAAARSSLQTKKRVATEQILFVLKRLRFHVVEGIRYWRVKRAWDNSPIQP